MTDIHSCSYFCDRPECIKAQRDELRERLAQPEQEPVQYKCTVIDDNNLSGVPLEQWVKPTQHKAWRWHDLSLHDIKSAIEAKLKEKNNV